MSEIAKYQLTAGVKCKSEISFVILPFALYDGISFKNLFRFLDLKVKKLWLDSTISAGWSIVKKKKEKTKLVSLGCLINLPHSPSQCYIVHFKLEKLPPWKIIQHKHNIPI